jgi:hypothetical protein
VRAAVLGVVGLMIFLIYMASRHYTLAGSEGFLMLLGNTYGFLIIIVLLGNGIVEVPRRLWVSTYAEQVRFVFA